MKLLPGLNKCASEFAKFLRQKLITAQHSYHQGPSTKIFRNSFGIVEERKGVLVPEA